LSKEINPNQIREIVMQLHHSFIHYSISPPAGVQDYMFLAYKST